MLSLSSTRMQSFFFNKSLLYDTHRIMMSKCKYLVPKKPDKGLEKNTCIEQRK